MNQEATMQTLKQSTTIAPDIDALHQAPGSVDFVRPALVPSPEEAYFYSQYAWALNAFPTLREAIGHLSEELRKLRRIERGWQRREVITNVFLLSCALTDTLDDYISGSTYDFSKVAKAFPFTVPIVVILHLLFTGIHRLREAWFSRLRAWSENWRSAITEFLQDAMVEGPEQAALAQHSERLATLLRPKFPKRLWNARPKIPAFFRSRDFAPDDCLELGRKFVDAFPGFDRPVMVMGVRTAGSFLAPLLCAYLRTRIPGVDWTAVRPKKGLASWERSALRAAARRRARVVVIDESIHSGQTLVSAIAMLRQVGFKDHDMVVLNPAEPAFPDWKDAPAFQCLPEIHTITLEPAERYKQRLLGSHSVDVLLSEYFRGQGYRDVQVSYDPEIAALNSGWRTAPPERVDVRLKRVYAVELRDASGQPEIRYVLAKSVGWGWLAYHAFHLGQALAKFVPPMLGLRDGILYTEWIPQEPGMLAMKTATEVLGAYVAVRAKCLKFDNNSTLDLVREGRHKGLEMLATALSRAYGSRVAAAAKRSRIQESLSRIYSRSVLTDSKMAPEEWISSESRLVKTDFEHHGQGKNELGMTDPAYDLADAIFHFGLSEDEARQLVEKYIVASGDVEVEERLFLHKLLAGLWAQNLATLGLQDTRFASRRHEFHRQYVSAWNFLVCQTVRECGRLCRGYDNLRWHSPLVVLDIDGVLDRMVFGFPSTTAAGIKALCLLARHGFAIALNTARTLREVKEYCEAYGLTGGVAEYGSVAWDRLTNRCHILVDAEAMRQLEEARRSLAKIPGVFLNEDYQYSLRAFTYENGRTVPLPRLMTQDLLKRLNLDRLHTHQTGLDSAITSKSTDKGKGLHALLSFAGLSAADVIAVGDSEPDLAMFRVAGRSFAPGNVSCRKEAQLLGCQIAKARYQPGLLEIARTIVHPGGGACGHCRDVEATWPRDARLFVSLLTAADQNPFSLLLRNSMDPSLLRIFRK
jgi:hydroxymethylpyrimidine pyrophosphatase-like HAD family hydrolase